jgi:lipid A 4'-phosphatase
MGYILIAGAILVPDHRHIWRRRLLLAGVLGYGTLMGLARVVQGGHFASDVVWSGFLMCLTVGGVHKALGVYPGQARRRLTGADTPATKA